MVLNTGIPAIMDTDQGRNLLAKGGIHWIIRFCSRQQRRDGPVQAFLRVNHFGNHRRLPVHPLIRYGLVDGVCQFWGSEP